MAQCKFQSGTSEKSVPQACVWGRGGITGARSLPGPWSHVLLGEGCRVSLVPYPFQCGRGCKLSREIGYPAGVGYNPGTTKAGGTHPTGMFSCLSCIHIEQKQMRK